MFTFGLFSTHMPYVVMVAVSAFYFLFSSPAFSKAENKENDQQVTKTEVSATENNNNNHTPATFFFAVLCGQDCTSSLRLPPVRQVCYSPPDEPPPGQGWYFRLFSRPPPPVA